MNKAWRALIMLFFGVHSLAESPSASIKPSADTPKMEVVVTVVDEAGVPITGANVVIVNWYYLPNSRVANEHRAVAQTNQQGKTSELTSFGTGSPIVHAEQEGFFPSRLKVTYPGDLEEGYRTPRKKPVQITLRKRVIGAALFRNRVAYELPKDIVCAYDILIADWLPPLGRGEVGDIFFKWKGEYRSERDRSLELVIHFAHSESGIQEAFGVIDESTQAVPPFAPDDGYQAEYSLFYRLEDRAGRPQITQTYRKDRHHFFKIVRDSTKGKKVMFGKIENDMYVSFLKPTVADIDFTFFLNPDGTRNTVYDPEKNLTKRPPK